MLLRGMKFLSQCRKIWKVNSIFAPQRQKVWEVNYNFAPWCRNFFKLNYNFDSQCRKICGVSPVYSHPEQTRLNFRKRVLINGNECIVLFLHSIFVQFLHSHSTTFTDPCVSSFMDERKFYTFLFSFWNENNQILALRHVSLDLNFREIQFYWDAFIHYQANSAFLRKIIRHEAYLVLLRNTARLKSDSVYAAQNYWENEKLFATLFHE